MLEQRLEPMQAREPLHLLILKNTIEFCITNNRIKDALSLQ